MNCVERNRYDGSMLTAVDTIVYKFRWLSTRKPVNPFENTAPRRKQALALVTKWCPSSFLAFSRRSHYILESSTLVRIKKQIELSTQWGGQPFPSTSTGQNSVSPNMWCLLASLAGATVTSPLIPVPHKGAGTIWNPCISDHPPQHHKITFGYFSRVTCASFSSIIQLEA